jgi:hypothetical protein
MEADNESQQGTKTPDTKGKPVVIHAENGSVVTVNVHVNHYYGSPVVVDHEVVHDVVGAIKGGG